MEQSKIKIWDSGKRENLKDIVPLETPLCLHVEPSGYCNFKCVYCAHSLSDEMQKEIGMNKTLMSKQLFFKIVDDCRDFNAKIKALRFAGLGDPLVNKNLPEMIEYANKQNVFEQITVFTNALLLDKEYIDRLVNSRVDVVRIALQGLSSEEYYKNCGVKIDFDEFINTLKYLYENKKNARIFVKILDFAIEGREDKFFSTFENICDEIDIEELNKATSKIDYSKLYSKIGKNLRNKPVSVCPFVFYQLSITANGEARSCCSTERRLVCGNANDERVEEIWSCDIHKKTQIDMLKKGAENMSECKGCEVYKQVIPESDNLDDIRYQLLEKLEGSI